MNRKELIDKVAKDTEMTKKDIALILDGTILAIEKSVANGEKVSLTGFGTFLYVERAARHGRNPKTGKTIEIKARRVPKFRAGTNLKDNLK